MPYRDLDRYSSRRAEEAGESESLGSLEALLLGIMKDGAEVTLYKLFSEMGLSQGSTSRALQKLHKLGLARIQSPSGYKKIVYGITEAGARKLDEAWQAGVAHSHLSVGETLISIALAKILGDQEELRKAVQALKDTAGERRVEARTIMARATKHKPGIMYAPSAQYGLWRAIYEAGRIQGEGDALDRIVGILEARPEVPQYDEEADFDLGDEKEG